VNEISTPKLWLMRGAFALLALLNLFFHVRRPEFVPPVILALLFLLTDFLLQRPPGLWALLALLACENFKMRGRSLRDATFPAEWLAAALLMVAVMLSYRIVLALALVPLPSWRLTLTELIFTILIYPVVVAFTHLLMGVRKSAPGDLDARGQRI